MVSVHDVSFLEHPEYFTSFRALQLRLTVRRTVKAASCVLTRQRIFQTRRFWMPIRLPDDKVVGAAKRRKFGIPPGGSRNGPTQHATAVAAGALHSDRWRPAAAQESPGTDSRPSKISSRAHPQLPHHLVVVGKETWYAPTVRAAAKKSQVADRIHFTGFVDDEELRRLYGACDLFVYPSFYEGFGLPILEAMACGRAVACSNTSAMPEVADSAALLFDPSSKRDLVFAMRDLLLNPELRQRMERLGVQRAGMFSWTSSAAKTLDLYYAVAGQASKGSATVRKSKSVVPR